MSNQTSFIIALFILLLAATKPVATQAQETPCGSLRDTSQKGSVTYHNNPQLDTLIHNIIQENKENPMMEGYRIQIHYGSNRDKAKEVAQNFEEAFPDYNADLIYEQPYFKIRTGKFRSKIEAHSLFYEIKDEFSSAFIVPDEIELPEL